MGSGEASGEGRAGSVDPMTVEVLHIAFETGCRLYESRPRRGARTPITYLVKDSAGSLFNEQADLLSESPGLAVLPRALDQAVKVVRAKARKEAGEWRLMSSSTWLYGIARKEVRVVG